MSNPQQYTSIGWRAAEDFVLWAGAKRQLREPRRRIKKNLPTKGHGPSWCLRTWCLTCKATVIILPRLIKVDQEMRPGLRRERRRFGHPLPSEKGSVRACTWHRMNPSADMHFLGGRVTSVVIERWCKSVAPMGNGRVGGAGVCTAPKVPFHERRASRSRQRTQEVGYRNREIQYFGYRGKSANAQDRICLGFAGFLW